MTTNLDTFMPRPDPISYSDGGLDQRFFACLAVVAWHGVFAHFAVVAQHGIFASAEIITTTKQKTEHAAYRNAEPAHLNVILDLVSASMFGYSSNLLT